MNRIFVVGYRFDILIVAFVLMDTHVHFILYGDFDACSRFMHEYVRITSMYMSSRYMEYKSLKNIEIPLPSMEVQKQISDRLDVYRLLCNDITSGLPAEIEARKKQYEYYRDKLLTFKELKKEA